jgi:glycosyltransferase involved in cell wall biosynthesis
MTRIALIPSSYPPALGGVEELTRHLALTLVAAGDEVEVWTCPADDSDRESVEIRDGLVVRRYPMHLPASSWSAVQRSLTSGTRTLLSLRRAVAAFRPDVLHVQCFGPNGAFATALARLTGVPLVVTLQGETMMDDGDIFEISKSLRAALRSGIKHAAVVTGCSAFTLSDAEKRFGLLAGRGQVIWNGVDLSQGASNPDGSPASDLGLTGAEPRPYILALGRVVEKKGFDLLLAAYAAMEPSERTAELVIAGAGGSLEHLKQAAVDLGVEDRVHFPGRLSREDVARAMADSELFIVPSRLEPFGIVILEGWRAGVTVVATTHGGPPEFVHDGKDGVLVDPFDTSAFASSLAQLLADPNRRSSIAAAGRARVQSFAWPAIAEQYRLIYATLGSRSSKAEGKEPGGTAKSKEAVA